MKLDRLKEKYGDVDEVALFQKATELRTDDLEFVYKALKYDADKVDKQALIDEAKRQLRAELEADKTSVQTTVGTKPQMQVANQVSLTADEKRIAAAMGMTEAEYAKWSQ